MLRKKGRKEGEQKEDKVGDGIKKDSVPSAGTEAPGSSALREIEHFGQKTWAMSHGLVQ